MLGKGLLLFRKRNRGRRRSRLGDNLAVGDGCGWRGHAVGGGGARAEDALLSWGNSNSGGHGSRSDLLGIDRDRGTVHGLGAGESLLRNSGDSAADVAVGVIDVGDGCCFVVNDRGVVDVGDGGVVDRCIANVDAVYVFAADAIRGDVNFPGRKREPADVGTEAASTAAADENHQSGGVDGANGDRSSHPTPAIVDVDPASIMERGIAPGSVIDPRPSPRGDPIPVSIVVGSPVGGDAIGEPDVTVFGVVAPVAVVVEVVVTHHVMRDVLGGA